MTAGEDCEFDTDVFTKNDGDGIWIYKSASSSTELNDTFKPVVYKISKDSLTVRVTNKTSGSSVNPSPTPTSTPQSLDPAKNSITGVYENTSYTVRTSRSFTATGVSNSSERYVPYEYYFNGTTVRMQDSNKSAADYSTSLSKTITMPSSSGTYELRVTFQRQTYNTSRRAWENATGTNSTYVKRMNIRVVSSTSSTSSSSSSSSASTRSSSTNSSTTSKSSGAKTGDQTPIGMYVGILLIAAIAIGGVLVYRKKTNKK